jgi:TfoX/Sxy family transcriptional regulator of competence genes
MADDPVADRLREALAGEPVSEQRMFGGTCFMLGGNMLAGSHKSELLVRVGKEAHAAALARPHSRPMEMRGRVMEGFVFVAADGFARDDDLHAWLRLARAYVDTLPPKKTGGPGKRAASAKTIVAIRS